MIRRHLTLSEPEVQCSDYSSYEELSSNSDSEESFCSFQKAKDLGFESEFDIINDQRRKSSITSTATNYRSWYLRRGSKVSANSLNRNRDAKNLNLSKESLISLTEAEKTYWYWMKLVVFISTPFIARQLGIFIGKRILVKILKDTKA